MSTRTCWRASPRRSSPLPAPQPPPACSTCPGITRSRSQCRRRPPTPPLTPRPTAPRRRHERRGTGRGPKCWACPCLTRVAPRRPRLPRRPPPLREVGRFTHATRRPPIFRPTPRRLSSLVLRPPSSPWNPQPCCPARRSRRRKSRAAPSLRYAPPTSASVFLSPVALSCSPCLRQRRHRMGWAGPPTRWARRSARWRPGCLPAHSPSRLSRASTAPWSLSAAPSSSSSSPTCSSHSCALLCSLARPHSGPPYCSSP
mmetsp:Transcript_12838/g.41966  ORF Transcript_12838/g.41966 Transcript_12838/m.41966 type:complete len:257 (+) Transcript_12838:534-1304(+)